MRLFVQLLTVTPILQHVPFFASRIGSSGSHEEGLIG